MEDQALALRSLFIGSIDSLKIAMKKAMMEQNISGSPLLFFVLDHIQNIPNCTALDISQKMHRDKGQVTRVIKELIDKGLVTKQINQRDRRSNFIFLTEEGKAYHRILKHADNDAITLMKTNISSEELDTFLRVGQRMLQNIQSHIKEP
ncbi:Multidrug resistance operon repressor [Marinomonas spartinae]|uniref:Multidrug resistance operon repressor n=1 Tax=Marinomonas spartinae TaxID=1792290 RepID=A0A1A8T984_9GAMM|nr:MarR family transcriptional regulator [Marinomonas spartinae]SBS27918.1 Multidrug resistance operon repressor [Marinomonas spartinae]SBS28523.1 Multidrug resistance operon repressor [Marinomonas spartinae]